MINIKCQTTYAMGGGEGIGYFSIGLMKTMIDVGELGGGVK